jgi:colicin import membrane protein
MMGDADSTARKARAQAEAAERDLKLTERAAAAALERAQRAKLVLKKAKKDSKKAAKAARKARKAADAASEAFTKATARVTKAEALISATRKGKKKRVTEATATNGAATKSAAMKAVSTKDVASVVTRKKAVSHKRGRRNVIARGAKKTRAVAAIQAPATEPAIPTAEPSGESETFVLGESSLN